MKNNNLTPKQRFVIEEVVNILSMEDSSFDNLWENESDPLPKTEKEVTEFIRRRTKLWRESWSIGPLKELLK